MPAAAPSRQPGASNRFSGSEAQRMLAGERRWLAAQLATRPARSWLWLAPSERPHADVPVQRGLWLREDGDGGYAGAVRCGLPLPVPNDCLGDVVLQHPQVHDAGPLLAECARVLIDGGRLWLFLGNPWSPYRLRRKGVPVALAGSWQQRLRSQGLQVEPPRFIGPCWRLQPPEGDDHGAWQGDGRTGSLLRACCVVVAEKRVVPVTPTPVAWRRGAAPAA
jgi:SAM-dependent methyltransferase